jgi:hypothetical protein
MQLMNDLKNVINDFMTEWMTAFFTITIVRLRFSKFRRRTFHWKQSEVLGPKLQRPLPEIFYYFMSTSLETTIPIGFCQICSIYKFHLSEYTKISCLSSIIKRNSLPGKIARLRFNAFFSLVPKRKISNIVFANLISFLFLY